MQTLASVDQNVWEVIAPLKVPLLKMDHRMTIVRLSSGELVIHSPVAYSAELDSAIRELGPAKWFIAPNRFHDMYWMEWFHAFPKARFLAAPGVREEHRDLPFTDALDTKNDFWNGEVVPMPIRGMPRLNEVVLLHSASRSLIVADLIFNIDAVSQNAVGRWFLRVNKIYQKPGISRMFRAFIRDKNAFRNSLEQIASLNFDRTVLGHGPNLARKELFIRAVSDAGFDAPPP